MKCPKCAGLLTREDIREQGGRFQGWRCIQCGFRLDHQIVQNRTSAPPGPVDDKTENTSTESSLPRTGSRTQAVSRHRGAASKA